MLGKRIEEIACSRNGRNEARMSCCNRGSDKVYTHTHTHTYTLYVGKKRMRNKKARVLSVLYLRDISRADVGNALSIPLAATLPCKILI